VSRGRGAVLLFLVVVALSLPAYAYGDPSGGALFQLLLPMLAAIWAAWIVFANRILRRVKGLIRRLRGSESKEPAA
jgi:hypothetical protein